ncbi:11275_t:CDS:2 [Entrophospora sp. SA101]|nr:10425_t:CDS:2 [Entrophospora sp. SA101]CAJ0907981.1 11275_t:CDS:2 [Entrophospora sp. SA101]
MEYLKQIIILPLDLEWYDARSNANFLNAVDQLWHPFDLKGTTDVVILNKELKKKEQVKQNTRFQTQAQLLVANHYSNNNVLSLLNDLNNYWEFFWEYDTEICFYRPASEEPAIKMLHDYVYAESNSINVSLGSEFNVDENDYPLSKRRKSKSYN